MNITNIARSTNSTEILNHMNIVGMKPTLYRYSQCVCWLSASVDNVPFIYNVVKVDNCRAYIHIPDSISMISISFVLFTLLKPFFVHVITDKNNTGRKIRNNMSGSVDVLVVI